MRRRPFFPAEQFLLSWQNVKHVLMGAFLALLPGGSLLWNLSCLFCISSASSCEQKQQCSSSSAEDGEWKGGWSSQVRKVPDRMHDLPRLPKCSVSNYMLWILGFHLNLISICFQLPWPSWITRLQHVLRLLRNILSMEVMRWHRAAWCRFLPSVTVVVRPLRWFMSSIFHARPPSAARRRTTEQFSRLAGTARIRYWAIITTCGRTSLKCLPYITQSCERWGVKGEAATCWHKITSLHTF